MQIVIEPDLLYPLLRGRDVQRWQAVPSAYIIVPHTPQTSWQALSEEEMRARYPRVYSYLCHFKEALLSRAGYRLLRQNHPFYILGDIHLESFASFKVVWGRIARKIAAAVVSTEPEEKPPIPQETISLVPFENPIEAHYFCAVVNSAPFGFAVQSYSQKGGKSFGTPSILENVRVPRYDPINLNHCQLAALSQKAHAAKSAGDIASVREIEVEIDRLAAQLWGLTNEELGEIQQSLKEID